MTYKRLICVFASAFMMVNMAHANPQKARADSVKNGIQAIILWDKFLYILGFGSGPLSPIVNMTLEAGKDAAEAAGQIDSVDDRVNASSATEGMDEATKKLLSEMLK